MKYFSAICVSIAFASLGMTQTDKIDFVNRYLQNETKLFERYAYNKKVVIKHYDENGNLFSTSTFFTSQDKTFTLVEKPAGDGWAEIALPDNRYTVEQKNTPKITFHGGYKLFEYGFPDMGIDRMSAQLWPMRSYDMVFNSTVGDNFRLSQLRIPERQPYELLSLNEVSFHGQDAYCLEGKDGNRKSGKIYLHRPSLRYLGFENIVDSNQFEGKMIYQDDKNSDLPLPKQFEIWKTDIKGQKKIHSKEVIIEYADYTPSPDEFDIEKRFGLKPLPPKVKLRSDVTSFQKTKGILGDWLYGLGAVFAALTVVGWVFVKRKRSVNAQ